MVIPGIFNGFKRLAQSLIYGIIDSEGSTLHLAKDVEDAFISHFQKHSSTKFGAYGTGMDADLKQINPFNKLSAEDVFILSQPVTKEGIENPIKVASPRSSLRGGWGWRI